MVSRAQSVRQVGSSVIPPGHSASFSPPSVMTLQEVVPSVFSVLTPALSVDRFWILLGLALARRGAPACGLSTAGRGTGASAALRLRVPGRGLVALQDVVRGGSLVALFQAERAGGDLL